MSKARQPHASTWLDVAAAVARMAARAMPRVGPNVNVFEAALRVAADAAAASEDSVAILAAVEAWLAGPQEIIDARIAGLARERAKVDAMLKARRGHS